MRETLKFAVGVLVGLFAGYLPGLVIPIKFFLIMCLALMALAVVLFFIFHFGLRDFQEH
ncbi:MAG: hypothetical protein HY022_08260 [Chloroflexi bacterium]|nr:hypothetical protein [Chloroflexota bacterium]